MSLPGHAAPSPTTGVLVRCRAIVCTCVSLLLTVGITPTPAQAGAAPRAVRVTTTRKVSRPKPHAKYTARELAFFRAEHRAAVLRWNTAVWDAAWNANYHNWELENWDCVAVAEEGGDWQYSGSQYSSLGVLNQAVRENAPPDVALRILAGTASRADQVRMMDSIVIKHGFGAWAPSTVAKCS